MNIQGMMSLNRGVSLWLSNSRTETEVRPLDQAFPNVSGDLGVTYLVGYPSRITAAGNIRKVHFGKIKFCVMFISEKLCNSRKSNKFLVANVRFEKV